MMTSGLAKSRVGLCPAFERGKESGVRIFATEKDWCDADGEIAGDLIYSSFQWLKSAGRMAPLTVVSMESPAVLMGDFDLSPLQKFMGRRDLRMKRGEWVCCEGPEHHRICRAGADHFVGDYIYRHNFCDWQQVAEEGSLMRCRCGAPYFRNGSLYVEGRGYAKPAQMYGMDYDFDWVPPAPSPEKSPQEKALEDFIAKRKAKRTANDMADSAKAFRDSYPERKADYERAQALDRAMRRLSFHEQDIHTRLMPYRREE